LVLALLAGWRWPAPTRRSAEIVHRLGYALGPARPHRHQELTTTPAASSAANACRGGTTGVFAGTFPTVRRRRQAASTDSPSVAFGSRAGPLASRNGGSVLLRTSS
jgi:hypothetical protein